METRADAEVRKTLTVVVSLIVVYFGALPILLWLLLDISPPGMGIPLWAFYVGFLLLALFLAAGKMAVYLWKEVD